jgi:hypothetical protein
MRVQHVGLRHGFGLLVGVGMRLFLQLPCLGHRLQKKGRREARQVLRESG